LLFATDLNSIIYYKKNVILTTMKNKLYLIDGMSVAFRMYFAMAKSNFVNKNNEPTGAIFGFANMITNLLERLEPQNIAVCFDCREKTFRHNLYSEYKANRTAFPEELGVQLPYIKSFLDLVGISRIEFPGYEADDIIGTYCNQCLLNDWEVYCWTTDKDFYQLLDKGINIIRNSKIREEFEVIDVDSVKKVFGVCADEVIDYLALIGDASDNIPGVKGIGEKTAIPLIEQYKTIENIYQNIDKIDKPRLKQMLLEGKENAYLSKKLLAINKSVPLETSYDKLYRKEVNYAELDAFFAELGLQQLRGRWKGNQLKNIRSETTATLW